MLFNNRRWVSLCIALGVVFISSMLGLQPATNAGVALRHTFAHKGTSAAHVAEPRQLGTSEP